MTKNGIENKIPEAYSVEVFFVSDGGKTLLSASQYLIRNAFQTNNGRLCYVCARACVCGCGCMGACNLCMDPQENFGIIEKWRFLVAILRVFMLSCNEFISVSIYYFDNMFRSVCFQESLTTIIMSTTTREKKKKKNKERRRTSNNCLKYWTITTIANSNGYCYSLCYSNSSKSSRSTK